MAWQNPKINWEAANVVTKDDFNRIEGNIQELQEVKVTKEAGKRLMTDAEGTKLAGIQAGAQVNAVTSVTGKTGAVTLVKGDVGLGVLGTTL